MKRSGRRHKRKKEKWWKKKIAIAISHDRITIYIIEVGKALTLLQQATTIMQKRNPKITPLINK